MAKWTAADWDRSESAEEMLERLRRARWKHHRKMRLFCVALCNRFRERITDARFLAALEAAERDADRSLGPDEKRTIRSEALAAADSSSLHMFTRDWQGVVSDYASTACLRSLDDNSREAAAIVSSIVAHAACALTMRRRRSVQPTDEDWDVAIRPEAKLQANLLRHIVGNPLRPFPAPKELPAAVVQLAAALEAGEPVAFALRDALLEAGQTELAEHFAGAEPHPRGCWALDAIGGRA